MPSMAAASAAAVSKESAKPDAGPSSATSSNGAFCATVIITCWSLALAPRLTSHTLLPGVFCARFAASNNAWPGPGVQHRRQHHFILEGRTRRTGDRLQGLQRVGDKAATDHDLKRSAHSGDLQYNRLRLSFPLFSQVP